MCTPCEKNLKKHPKTNQTKSLCPSQITRSFTKAIIKQFHNAVLETGKNCKQIYSSMKRRSICNCLKFRDKTQDMEISLFFCWKKICFVNHLSWNRVCRHHISMYVYACENMKHELNQKLTPVLSEVTLIWV